MSDPAEEGNARGGTFAFENNRETDVSLSASRYAVASLNRGGVAIGSTSIFDFFLIFTDMEEEHKAVSRVPLSRQKTLPSGRSHAKIDSQASWSRGLRHH